MSSDGSEKRRVLCLDVGSRRIGVALGDPLGYTAQPLTVVFRGPDDASQIRDLVSEHDVATVVVGLPLALSGQVGPAVKRTRKFIDTLLPLLAGVELVEWDERMTTTAAERALIEGGVRRAQRKNLIDAVAASLILQSYLGSLQR
ncbi:MAG: hypothetical protein AUK47_24230 [Deltaproteobacteria bacterium CG2_30_63_29]|nr:MAG: hypothetical protein AUK47_24230 [Deltaproteobacteria bacterium CG2_30_63_29]PIW02572.1 MAG: Holliday junction resolvase RuvX [Deltaproteobacteria bacterium CG17_big_fil_post_rev_8_21_14_2_50_63_7]PJB36250.1 MAG: Holliday junction resolvase RuvX [Deltaproteobacteria bacterium CG_4_9_14_3_um_filter_63_12]